MIVRYINILKPIDKLRSFEYNYNIYEPIRILNEVEIETQEINVEVEQPNE